MNPLATLAHRFAQISIRSSARPAIAPVLSQARSVATVPFKNLRKGWEYLALSDLQKDTFVPAPRGAITDPASFLNAIGRKCGDVAAKFTSWEHLFKATSSEMKELGIDCQRRKYILGWRESFKRGTDPKDIPIPKRKEKYLVFKAKVKLLRLKKQGLA
ncbi:IGR protein motif-domain-containing protein [Polychytrium aggregatum]|uniref:IGR protein motif-domain-containing protein n=1 Tax=Polychytrium aggregatum TaxID=110093 RepID=UPI0022FDBD48|nr:IGR protein motif-domain-containing protein [Polychytrium aggregatum]KAI9202369.1 IGR protein motif-domain-containing protein [Polychytrium aggregatum]